MSTSWRLAPILATRAYADPVIRALPVDDPAFLDTLGRALAGELTLAPLPADPRAAATVQTMLAADDDPGDAALIVATSGSTGAPKGVRLSARALVASAESTRRRVGAGAWALALPLHYVAGAMVAVRALVTDRPLVRVRPDLADLQAPTAPTHLSLVPTQLARALDDPATRRALAAHATVLLGGAAAPDDLLARARAASIPVVTTYGMSETAGGCVYDGTPLDTTTITLDDDTGRIDLTGPMAFSGYHGRPDLTAETLTDHTVHTRDRGRLADGCLTVLGRLDDVVVTGGVNVDLAALEPHVQALHPGSAVVAVPDAEFGVRIVAAGPIPGDLAALRGALGVDGPARPRGLLRLDSLPLTASGKIDRQALIDAWPTADDKETW